MDVSELIGYYSALDDVKEALLSYSKPDSFLSDNGMLHVIEELRLKKYAQDVPISRIATIR